MRKPEKKFLSLFWKLTFSTLLLSCFFPLAYAETYPLTDLPQNVSDYFGLDSTFIAGLLISFVGLLFVICLVGYAVRNNKAAPYAILTTSFVGMGAFVALGFLPVWIMIVTILIIAVIYAGIVPVVFGGK